MKSKPTHDQARTPRATDGRAESSSAKPSRKNVRKHSRAKPSREKVRAYRKRMRAKGLRLVQMWLPDTRTPEFAARAHQASLAIANSPTEEEDQDFIDSVQWWTSEENTA
jgi:hypothetical protein